MPHAVALTDIVEKGYDETPYVSLPFSVSSPEHLASVAFLFGLVSAPPDKCRVLELGCAAGGNLIPHAQKHPDSEYIGVDLSQVQIDEGQHLIKSLGLKNVLLRRLNLANITSAMGEFDYIICHGVYSWVSEEIQAAILQICKQNLAADGLAFISYNVYPGWKFKEVVRDAMRFRGAQQKTASAKLSHARGMFDFLQSMTAPDSLLSMTLDQHINTIRTMRDDYLLHEYLEPYNQPCYFSDFIDRAQAHGLSYLADGAPSIMFVANLGAAISEPLLRECGDSQVHIEQYMDFLQNRQFRQTVLVQKHRQPDINYRLDRQRYERMHFAGQYALPTDSALTLDEAPQTFYLIDREIVVSTSICKAAMKVLGDHFPATLTVRQIVEDAQFLLQRVKPSDLEDIGRLLESLIIQGAVIFQLEPARIAARVAEQPIGLASARATLSVHDTTFVTNAWHNPVTLSFEERLILKQLDGTTNKIQLTALLLDQLKRGLLHFKNDDGASVIDPAQQKMRAEITVQSTLEGLCKKALLMVG